jgi:hypothetical protein
MARNTARLMPPAVRLWVQTALVLDKFTQLALSAKIA